MAEIKIWHDEIERYLATGRCDQGSCWCVDCLPPTIETNEGAR